MSKIVVEVPFFAESVQAVKDGEAVWVVVKRVCEALEIAEQRQSEKLKGKPWATTTLMVAVAEDGKNREVFCLDLESLPMWLATIDANRVKPEARFKLVTYQRECARVLRDHFFGAKAELAQSATLNALAAAVLAQATAMGEIRATLAALSERSNATVTRSEARSLGGRITRAGKLKATQQPHRTAKAWGQRIRMHVTAAAGWSGSGCCYLNMPAHAYPQAERAISLIERELNEAPPAPKRQLSLIKTG